MFTSLKEITSQITSVYGISAIKTALKRLVDSIFVNSTTGGRRRKSRGGCGCMVPQAGGYRATKKDKKYLRLYKQGKSIGFTMRASLKAKGLLPRANGSKRVSQKYRAQKRNVTRRRT